MNRIKALREEFGFTQQDLADKLSGAKSTVAMYENETRKPSMKILIKLSDIFQCSIDYLLGKSDVRQIGKNTNSWSLEDIGFNINNYVPPTDAQKEQIKNLIEIILKKNEKKNNEKG